MFYSLVDGHINQLAILNSAVINMDVQEYLLYAELHSFGYMLRRGIPISWLVVIIKRLKCPNSLERKKFCCETGTQRVICDLKI
jgi:hypothetical protein